MGGGRQVGQGGRGADAELQAGAAGTAEADLGGGDRDGAAHVQQQAGTRVQVPEAALVYQSAAG
jgi:hypothetical protein